MSVFRCKMCGGTLEVNESQTVAVCQYCGTEQTLPKLDDEKRANMYDRANHFRRNNEFDKAMGIYEQILSEDKTDAEAYWSLVLCRYGIEYVEDPTTHKRIPTVNRAQYTSVFDDDNYKSALEYADTRQKLIYEEEANAINEIQKGILAISQKEEPFDVFICYKESDANGRRTVDSVLATDLYHQLTQEGFKVFFSRITLEDKLGTAYEPYIFAALNSSKVMVVLGTKAEYFNAVWVKNEWSRYLSLVKESKGKKVLIPAYRDMDPYDLPEEFSHLQAQDMSKLGFMQDLIRGIKKIISFEKPKTPAKETVVVNNGGANVTSLLKRAFMFLEDSNWSDANSYCEKILDIDPENAQAYLAKLMAELKVSKQNELKKLPATFSHLNTYKKVIRFAPPELAKTLEEYNAEIQDKVEMELKEKERLEREKQFKEFQVEKERRKREEEERLEKRRRETQAIIAARKSKTRKKNVKIFVAILLMVTIVSFVLIEVKILPNIAYNKGVQFLEQGAYDEAICEFKSVEKFKNVEEVLREAYYGKGILLLKNGEYNEAISAFELAMGYKDSEEKIKSSHYEMGKLAIKQKDYRSAVPNLMMAKGFEDSAELLRQINFQSISAGKNHTVAIKSDATAIATGSNEYGQCDVYEWNNLVSIDAGELHTIALKSDGTVIATGDNSYGQCNVSGWKDVVAISAGQNCSVGLKSDGTVLAVGDNKYGQCDVSEWKDIVAISSGGLHTVGLKSDGTVLAKGYNGFSQCNVSSWKDIVAISAGNLQTIGLSSDGTVKSLGDRVFGQCDVYDWSDIIAISAGGFHTAGLITNGNVISVGGDRGQYKVNNWTGIVAISAGTQHNVGLKSDGTVVAVGLEEDGQCDVSDWSDIKLPLS